MNKEWKTIAILQTLMNWEMEALSTDICQQHRKGNNQILHASRWRTCYTTYKIVSLLPSPIENVNPECVQASRSN